MALTVEQIKHGRTVRGLTQAELATATGLSVSSVSAYEHGTRNLTEDASKLIEAVFTQISPLKDRSPQLTKVADLADITTLLQYQGTRLNASQAELLRVLAKTMIDQKK